MTHTLHIHLVTMVNIALKPITKISKSIKLWSNIEWHNLPILIYRNENLYYSPTNEYFP